MRNRLLFLGLLALLTGCGGGMGSGMSPSLTGRWAAPFTFPGIGTSMTLQSTGAVVTGTGAYSLEAGPSGTFQVSGTTQGSSFSLNLNYDNGSMRDYEGTITDANHLNGTVHTVGFSDYTLSLVRQ